MTPVSQRKERIRWAWCGNIVGRWVSRRTAGGGEPVGQHEGCEPADRLASIFAARVGGRPSAQKTGWDSRGNPVCNEANPCPATNPGSRRTGRAAGAGVGGCRLWDRHTVPGSDQQTGIAVCSRNHVLGERLEGGGSAVVQTEVEGDGTSHQAVATRQPPSAASGQRPGAQSAGFGLEDRDLAASGKTKSSFALRCRTRSARASRLLAKRAASGRVAVDGMAPRGGRTNQILAFYASGRHDPE